MANLAYRQFEILDQDGLRRQTSFAILARVSRSQRELWVLDRLQKNQDAEAQAFGGRIGLVESFSLASHILRLAFRSTLALAKSHLRVQLLRIRFFPRYQKED
jgi:hypothetical protein